MPDEKNEVVLPHDMNAIDLVRRAVANARPNSALSTDRWAAVMDTFGMGSTYSLNLCRAFGINPNEEVGGTYCEVCSHRAEQEGADSVDTKTRVEQLERKQVEARRAAGRAVSALMEGDTDRAMHMLTRLAML